MEQTVGRTARRRFATVDEGAARAEIERRKRAINIITDFARRVKNRRRKSAETAASTARTGTILPIRAFDDVKLGR